MVTDDLLNGSTELGHLLETFAVGELIKQASWTAEVAGLGHWRTRDGVAMVQAKAQS